MNIQITKFPNGFNMLFQMLFVMLHYYSLRYSTWQYGFFIFWSAIQWDWTVNRSVLIGERAFCWMLERIYDIGTLPRSPSKCDRSWPYAVSTVGVAMKISSKPSKKMNDASRSNLVWAKPQWDHENVFVAPMCSPHVYGAYFECQGMSRPYAFHIHFTNMKGRKTQKD